jgi:prevent-host-death family protein
MRVTSSEFQKHFDSLADKALTEPVIVTRNEQDRLVLMSVEEYDRLKRRERRVVRLEYFYRRGDGADRPSRSSGGIRPPRCRAERLEAVSCDQKGEGDLPKNRICAIVRSG